MGGNQGSGKKDEIRREKDLALLPHPIKVSIPVLSKKKNPNLLIMLNSANDVKDDFC